MGVRFSCLNAFIQWCQARAGWIFHPSMSLGSFGNYKQAAPCMQARKMPAHSFYLAMDDFGLLLSNIWGAKLAEVDGSLIVIHYHIHSLPVWPDWAIFCTLDNHSKQVATNILLKLPTLLGNFSKCAKSFIFLVKSFLGNFYRHLAIFFWSHCSVCTCISDVSGWWFYAVLCKLPSS